MRFLPTLLTVALLELVFCNIYVVLGQEQHGNLRAIHGRRLACRNGRDSRTGKPCKEKDNDEDDSMESGIAVAVTNHDTSSDDKSKTMRDVKLVQGGFQEARQKYLRNKAYIENQIRETPLADTIRRSKLQSDLDENEKLWDSTLGDMKDDSNPSDPFTIAFNCRKYPSKCRGGALVDRLENGIPDWHHDMRTDQMGHEDRLAEKARMDAQRKRMWRQKQLRAGRQKQFGNQLGVPGAANQKQQANPRVQDLQSVPRLQDIQRIKSNMDRLKRMKRNNEFRKRKLGKVEKERKKLKQEDSKLAKEIVALKQELVKETAVSDAEIKRKIGEKEKRQKQLRMRQAETLDEVNFLKQDIRIAEQKTRKFGNMVNNEKIRYKKEHVDKQGALKPNMNNKNRVAANRNGQQQRQQQLPRNYIRPRKYQKNFPGYQKHFGGDRLRTGILETRPGNNQGLAVDEMKMYNNYLNDQAAFKNQNQKAQQVWKNGGTLIEGLAARKQQQDYDNANGVVDYGV